MVLLILISRYVLASGSVAPPGDKRPVVALPSTIQPPCKLSGQEKFTG